MNERAVLFANMPNSFAILRRCASKRVTVCTPRMALPEDTKESMDRLRRIQQSVLKRRGKARGVSSASEVSENVHGGDADTGQEGSQKANRARDHSDVDVGTPSNCTDLPTLDKEPLRSETPALHRQHQRHQVPLEQPNQPLKTHKQRASLNVQPRAKASSDRDLESINAKTHSLFSPTSVGNILSADVPRRTNTGRCTLEKRDGSLPIVGGAKRKTLASLATADPINVLIPALEEFTGSVPFQKGQWHLPRTNGMEPILSPLRIHEPQTVLEDLNDDCVQILSSLNPQQALAVTAELKRACLVLAGPGSGKTRVLTHRAAYLCRRYHLAPHRILAVTFTNKAAEEMKSRLRDLLTGRDENEGALFYRRSDFVVGTFHSICARILRTYGSAIGINSDFQICDASDSRQVVAVLLKEAVGESSVKSERLTSESTMLSKQISRLKNHGDDEMKKSLPRHIFAKIDQYRHAYDKKLRSMNQLDFDDLLLETWSLLNKSPESLQELQAQYVHVLVDEWQDTNTVQFDIVAKLAEKNGNIFVVGDDDQSIFKFRGADSRNLTRFTERFPEARIVTLEKNYRSTGCIVSASQGVIESNRNRPSKTMHTSNAFGDPVVVCEVFDGRAEAEYIVESIHDLLKKKKIDSLSNVAVLYRTNAQSRPIEEACIKSSMRYRLVGGTRFYDRQEVKDIMSYVRLLVNPSDDIAMLRAINTPNRGIGPKTVEVLQETASQKNISILRALEFVLSKDSKVIDGDLRKNALKRLSGFYFTIEKLKAYVSNDQQTEEQDRPLETVADVIAEIVKVTNFKPFLQKRLKSDEESGMEKFAERWRNVEELESAAARHTSLTGFMENVSLFIESSNGDGDDSETGDRSQDGITLLTLHSGKGLEFEAVFIAGFEEGTLPMVRSQDPIADAEAVEEERRLAYVGMTRAKKHLTLLRRTRTLVYGQRGAFWRDLKPSRFLNDIPNNLVQCIRFPSSSSTRGRYGDRLTKKNDGRTTQWNIGDSVRCPEHGRGTVVSKKTVYDGAQVEVIFTSGKRELLNPVTSHLELLYSPSSAN